MDTYNEYSPTDDLSIVVSNWMRESTLYSFILVSVEPLGLTICGIGIHPQCSSRQAKLPPRASELLKLATGGNELGSTQEFFWFTLPHTEPSSDEPDLTTFSGAEVA